MQQCCGRYADTGKNIGDYRESTNFDCHVSSLRFTDEWRALSNFDGQGSVARFTGDRHVQINGEGQVFLVRCIPERAYLKQILSSTLEIPARVVEQGTISTWSYWNIDAKV